MAAGDYSREWGKIAEQIAVDHLVARGYVIRERNWRPSGRHLEVDIVAEKDMRIVFVEVKARSEDGEDPVDAVDLRKQRRLVKAADTYLRAREHDYEYRFDIIAVSGDATDYDVDHLEDAFLPPLS